VAKLSLRRPDTQATASMVLSLSALFFSVGLVVILFPRFDTDNNIIWYKSGGPRHMAVLGCTAISLLLGVLGFGFGLNSAGARRNERNSQSWLGFFAGAAAITLTVILFAAFYLLKQSVA